MTARGSRALARVVGVSFCLVVSGCPKQRSTMTRPPEINPPPKVETSAEVRVEELDDRAKQFAQTAERLPGRSSEEHRHLAQQAFADLAQILPILFGPSPTGVQRQQLRVVESTRAQLAANTRGLAPEPTIDTGLRAARDALAGVARGGFYDHPELPKSLDRLDATVADLDAARGTIHQQVVAETVELMSQAVNQMAEALNQRLEGDGAEGERGKQGEEDKGTRGHGDKGSVQVVILSAAKDLSSRAQPTRDPSLRSG